MVTALHKLTFVNYSSVKQPYTKLVFSQIDFHAHNLLSDILLNTQFYVAQPSIQLAFYAVNLPSGQPSIQLVIHAVNSLPGSQPSLQLAFLSFIKLTLQSFNLTSFQVVRLPSRWSSKQLSFYAIGLRCSQPFANLTFLIQRFFQKKQP